jgi:hypothetical protein
MSQREARGTRLRRNATGSRSSTQMGRPASSSGGTATTPVRSPSRRRINLRTLGICCGLERSGWRVARLTGAAKGERGPRGRHCVVASAAGLFDGGGRPSLSPLRPPWLLVQFRLDVEPRNPLEPAREVPVPVAEQLHRRGQQHAPDQGRIEQDGEARPRAGVDRVDLPSSHDRCLDTPAAKAAGRPC